MNLMNKLGHILMMCIGFGGAMLEIMTNLLIQPIILNLFMIPINIIMGTVWCYWVMRE